MKFLANKMYGRQMCIFSVISLSCRSQLIDWYTCCWISFVMSKVGRSKVGGATCVDQSVPHSTIARRERSRKLAQRRRDTYKTIMDDLTGVCRTWSPLSCSLGLCVACGHCCLHTNMQTVILSPVKAVGWYVVVVDLNGVVMISAPSLSLAFRQTLRLWFGGLWSVEHISGFNLLSLDTKIDFQPFLCPIYITCADT